MEIKLSCACMQVQGAHAADMRSRHHCTPLQRATLHCSAAHLVRQSESPSVMSAPSLQNEG